MPGVGSLVIEIGANIARLQTDMARAVGVVDRATSGIRRAATLAAGALGAIGAGLSLSALTGSVRQIIDFGDKLRDLSFATGQSVEQLSFLDYAAGQSGTSIETISGATLRLSKNLLEIANGGAKPAAAALDRLGVSAADLSRVDLATKISTIGQALAGVVNPTERAALGATLFGKQFRELAPLILEGERGIAALADRFLELNGAITTDQANKFDAFNDAIGDLNIAARAAGVTLADALAPALTKFFNALTAGIPFVRETFAKFIDDLVFSFIDLQVTVVKATNAVSNFFNKRSGRGALGGDDGTTEVTKRIQELRAVQDEIRKEVDRRALERVVTPEKRAALFSGGGADESIALGQSESARAAAARAAKREELANIRRNADALRDTRALIDEEAQAWEQLDQRRKAAAQALETGQERALRKLAEAKELFGAESDNFGRAAIEAFNELNPEIDKSTTATTKLASAAEELGITFSSAFEDAIVNGAKFGDILKGIGQDILRIGIRETVTNPLTELLKGGITKASGSGGFLSGIGDFFKGLFGNARGGLYRVAGGGGEQPIAFTARAGEIVAVGTGAQSSGGGGVTIINNTGQQFGARDRGNVGGRRTIELGVLDAMTGAVATGAASRELGLAPRLVPR